MLLLAVLEKTKEKGHKPDKYIKNKKKNPATENKTKKEMCHRKQNHKNVLPQKTKNKKMSCHRKQKT